LQIIKRSCSIDSVQFEKKLFRSKQSMLLNKKRLLSFIQFVFKKIQTWTKKYINLSKKHVRKKLHPKTQKVTASSFIKEMNQ